MQKIVYKCILGILRGLMRVKRTLVSLYQHILPFLRKWFLVYHNNVGFRVYKILFYATRRIHTFFKPWKQNFFELFSKRSSLQIVFFLVILGLMFPYSRLYSKTTSEFPGRDTLLYAIAGPGDQNFDIEEVTADQIVIGDIVPWQEGAISTDVQPTIPGTTQEQQEIAGLSPGGNAIQNPTIISGDVTSPSSPSSGSGISDTGKIIKYQVRSGDTIGQIATAHGVSVQTILWANNLTSRSYIRPGDTLTILPTSGVLHKVVRGDTIGKIASKYDAKSSDIIAMNKLKNDGSDIVIGEELIIPGGTKSATIAVTTPNTSRPLGTITAPPAPVTAPAGSTYIWPTNVRRVTQYFGLRHTGVDIAGPVGSPLYASRAGKVILSQCGWNGGYGCHVRIDHGGGVMTLYAHASQLLVNVGDTVTQGQVIALMGSTGRSTGPHIHFEVRVNGRYQNPFSYVR